MYLTDGVHLFEIIAEDLVRNYGLGSSFIREAAIRDSVTGETRFLWGPQLAELRKICEW